MSEKENFLKRWSKRKLAERERSTLGKHAANEDPAAREEPIADVEAAAPAPKNDDSAAIKEHTPELPTLPPLESIGAGSDIAAFLRPGVPVELTRAALRRAWTSDPAIRDFVGLVENGWDFNDPAAMAGFGPIGAQEVARLVSELIGEVGKPAATEPAAETPIIERSPDSALPPALETTTREDASEACSEKEKENDAPQQKDVP